MLERYMNEQTINNYFILFNFYTFNCISTFFSFLKVKIVFIIIIFEDKDQNDANTLEKMAF